MNNNSKILMVKKFATSTSKLDEIRDFVSDSLKSFNISDDLIYNITLAVDEACTNVIKHAYDNSECGEMIVRIEFDGNKLNISVIDFGKGFDPSGLPVPNIKEYYKAHKVGGWGIHLMKSLMDEVKFNLNPGVQNEIALIKYIK